MRRLLSGFLMASLLLTALPATAQAETSPVEVTIIHDSHVHGNFASNNTDIAQKAYIINEIRSRKPDALFVGNGDDLGTSILSNEFQGAHVIDAFNRMGMAVNTMGNHDFDMGPEVFLARAKESGFIWVSANLRDVRTGEVFGKEIGVQEFVIQDVHGVKVGFTGLAPAETLTLSSPGPNVKALGYAEAMREVLPQMRAAGAQVTVVLSHICGAETEALAAEVDGIDAIVGDHCATVLDQPIKVKNTIISRVGDEFKNVGELTLKVQDGKVTGFTFTKHAITAESPKDPTIGALITDYQAKLDASMEKVIGTTATPLDTMKSHNRLRETATGNLVSDVARAVMQADIGLTNGGNIRADQLFQPGPLTKKDIINTLPFTNYLMKIEVKGQAIKEALELSASTIGTGNGRFLQVSGLTFRLNPTRAVGDRVSEVKVGGEPLDLAKAYTVGLNNFTAGGGDGYTMFQDAKVLVDANAGPLVSTGVIEAIEKAGTIAPRTEGRILITAGVSLEAGKAALTIAGGAQKIDVAPAIQNGAFHAPLRAVAELYGAAIEWQAESSTAVVTMPWGATATVKAGANGYIVENRLLVAPQVLQQLGIKTKVDGDVLHLSL